MPGPKGQLGATGSATRDPLIKHPDLRDLMNFTTCSATALSSRQMPRCRADVASLVSPATTTRGVSEIDHVYVTKPFDFTS